MIERTYYIDFCQNRKRIRRSVGKDASAANVARIRQEQLLASRNAGLKVTDPDESGPSLSDAADAWLFLMTGMREQEVMHATWPDVNLARAVVTVRHKPEYGFSPKTYKGREIPIPNKLVQSLKNMEGQD